MGNFEHLDRKSNSADFDKPAASNRERADSTQQAIDASLERATDQSTALDQAKLFGLHAFEVLKSGAAAAIAQVEAPELPKDDSTKLFIGAAAAALVGATSGALAGWIVAGVAGAFKDKAASLVSGALSGAVKKAVEGGGAARVASIDALKDAFSDAVEVKRLEARQRFVSEWPQIRKLLSVLPQEDLHALNKLNKEQDTAKTYGEIKRATFVSWTNFLARERHGGGPAWDHWAENGSRNALALSDSATAPAKTGQDPTSGNVDHTRMDWALEQEQRPMDGEHYGVLEVFLDLNMRLVDRPGYRMRLDNVGPKVRRSLRADGGRVGDLPVNKIVRLCSNVHKGVRVNPPVAVAAILITADGYVRATNWAEFERLYFKPTSGPVWDPGGFGQCMDQLRDGHESVDCYLDRATKAKEVTAYAEAAQNLPMNLLGEP